MTTRSAPGPATLVSLGALYLSQGLPYGFFTQAVPVLLRESGASLPAIGLANVLLLPWALKFLWAPRIDALAHRRRALVLGLQVATALALAAPAVFAPTGMSAMAALLATMFIVSTLSATQDVATDAFAVEALEGRSLGFGNALQVGGYRVGMIVGGGAMLALFATAGWGASFGAMAGLLLLATVPLLWGLPRIHGAGGPAPRNAPGHPEEDASWRAWWLAPDPRAWLYVLVAAKLGDALGGAMVKPMLVDAGVSKLALATWLGTWGSAAALVGALAGGLLVARLGALRAAVVFGVLQALPQLGWAALATPAPVGDVRIVAVADAPSSAGGLNAHIDVTGLQGDVAPRIMLDGLDLGPGLRVPLNGPAGTDVVRLEVGVPSEVPAGADVTVRVQDEVVARAARAWRPEQASLWRRVPPLVALAVLENLLGSVVTVSLFAAMMTRCRPAHAGTDYTVQACVLTLVAGGASVLAGVLAEALGWSGFFGVSALVSLVGVGLVERARRLQGQVA